MDDYVQIPDSADGILEIYIVRARNLPNRRSLVKQSPYVTLRVGIESRRTNSHFQGGQTPSWKELVKFELRRDRRPIMKVDVLDETKGDPTPIGSCEIDCALVFRYPQTDGTYFHSSEYELQFNDQVHGSIRIELTFIPTKPMLPPKIKSPSFSSSQAHTVVSEDPRGRYQDFTGHGPSHTNAPMAIDEHTFNNEAYGLASPIPDSSSNYGSHAGSRYSNLGESTSTVATSSTGNTSASSRGATSSAFVDEQPELKKIFHKLRSYFIPPQQNEASSNSVWESSPPKKPKIANIFKNIKKSLSPSFDTPSSYFEDEVEALQPSPPVHLNSGFNRFATPEPSYSSGFAPFPESNAGFEAASPQSNYTLSPNIQTQNISPNHSRNYSKTSSPTSRPNRKPPPGISRPSMSAEIPDSADSIGMNTTTPLPPLPEPRDPDALTAAPQPTSQMNYNFRMLSGQATQQDLAFDLRTKDTGYLGHGNFSPNAFDLAQLRASDREQLRQNPPPVPPKVPIGSNLREHYLVDQEKYLSQIRFGNN